MKKRIFYWSGAMAAIGIGLLGLLGGTPLRQVKATPVTYSKTITVLPSDCAETSVWSDPSTSSHSCYKMINGIKVSFYAAQVYRKNVNGVDYLYFKPTVNGTAVSFAGVVTNVSGAHGTGYTKIQFFDETSLRVGTPSISVAWWDTSDSKGTNGVYTCTVGTGKTAPPQLMMSKGNAELYVSKIIATYGCTSGS